MVLKQDLDVLLSEKIRLQQQLDEAEYCDRISIMNSGRIVAPDTPYAFKKQEHAGQTPSNRVT